MMGNPNERLVGKRFKQLKVLQVRGILLGPRLDLPIAVASIDTSRESPDAKILAMRRMFYFVFGISPNTRLPCETYGE